MKQISIHFFSLLIISIVFIQCKQSKKLPKKNITQFNWLSGSWEMKEADGIVTEQWKQVNDSLMERGPGPVRVPDL